MDTHTYIIINTRGCIIGTQPATSTDEAIRTWNKNRRNQQETATDAYYKENTPTYPPKGQHG